MSAVIESRNEAKPDLETLRAVLFGDMAIDGVVARTALYERVIAGLSGLIGRLRPVEAESFSFPPVMSRVHIQKAGYFKSFPQLLGCVCCLDGDETQIRQAAETIELQTGTSPQLSNTDLVLTPAACYPIYPIAAARGTVGSRGLCFDVSCDCFRREPSRDLDRLQSFRMREFVRIGTERQVTEFREIWIKKALEVADMLGLNAEIETANDPFFGRGGQLAAISQRMQSLKFELLVPIKSHRDRTACMSFNYHRTHFGELWDLHDAKGASCHTGCVAFGVDRLAIALFAKHGVSLSAWPSEVAACLNLSV